jgi:dGTPase
MQLASYAFVEKKTQGRKYPEPVHSYRLEFQRDRDRVIHTRAFRRLEKKTQVFPPEISDHFRNRLTHTLEVTQISRSTAQVLNLNTDLCEVLALSHDIGHPPFSHVGERVLNELMLEHGEGFEHNLHALRIVEDFEVKYPAFRGLNLTFEVREGIIKHSRDYEPGDRSYIDIRGYRLGERPPLEAQIIDVADEIAYSSADLEDGYVSGLINVEQMILGSSLFRGLWEGVAGEYPAASERIKLSEVIRRIIDCLASSLAENTRKVLAEKKIVSVEDVRSFPGRLAGMDPETARENQELKDFLFRYLYNHEKFVKGRGKAQDIIRSLFRFYLENPDKLSISLQERIDSQGLPRMVCDYIAGMTDNYAESKIREI